MKPRFPWPSGSILFFAFFFGLIAIAFAPLCFAQDSTNITPPPYRGAVVRIDGVFVTPVANAPFSATVTLQSKRTLSDGSVETQKSIAHIARDSQGRIYNEHRPLVPSSWAGTPGIQSIHIFDPETRQNIFLNPGTRIARESILPGRLTPPRKNPNAKEEDLGTQVIENLVVHGVRDTWTIPANQSGTGNPIAITDETWFSEDLHMNIMTKHNDPRTGEQLVAVTQINREEPDAALFQVPEGYKVIDVDRVD